MFLWFFISLIQLSHTFISILLCHFVLVIALTRVFSLPFMSLYFNCWVLSVYIHCDYYSFRYLSYFGFSSLLLSPLILTHSGLIDFVWFQFFHIGLKHIWCIFFFKVIYKCLNFYLPIPRVSIYIIPKIKNFSMLLLSFSYFFSFFLFSFPPLLVPNQKL